VVRGEPLTSDSFGFLFGPAQDKSGVAAGACPERSRRTGARPADHNLGVDSVSRAWAGPLHWRVYYYRLS
jgi:hypothetical protein